MSEVLYDYLVSVPLTGEYNLAYESLKRMVVRATNEEQARKKGALGLNVSESAVVVSPMKRTELYGES